MNVIIDNWNGSQNKLIENTVESETEILNVFYMLDGEKHTEMIVDYAEDHSLVIGGGQNHDKYIVTNCINVDEFIYTLINPLSKSGIKIKLKTGGQVGIYDQKYVVNKEIVVDILKYAFKYRTMPEKYIWEIY